jgi:hypothetical protein
MVCCARIQGAVLNDFATMSNSKDRWFTWKCLELDLIHRWFWEIDIWTNKEVGIAGCRRRQAKKNEWHIRKLKDRVLCWTFWLCLSLPKATSQYSQSTIDLLICYLGSPKSLFQHSYACLAKAFLLRCMSRCLIFPRLNALSCHKPQGKYQRL